MIKKFIILLSVILTTNVSGGDFFAPFSGSRINGLTKSSTIAEYDSTVDVSSGNLIDKSGSNYLTYTDAFGSWTATRSSVLADQYRNPRTNVLDADVLREDGTAGNNHFVYNSYSTTSGVTYSYSVYVRGLYRTWVRLNVNTDGASAYFQLIGGGSAGTTASGVTAKIHRVSDNWYRCAIKWKSATTAAQQFEIYAAEADADVTFDGTLDRADLVLSGAQLSIMDSYRTDFPGVYHPVVATVTKPLLDLAPTAAPTESKSYLQTNEGRRLKARTFNGTTQYYSKAHDASMNVFDSAFTVTIVAKNTAGVNDTAILDHQSGTGGFQVTWNTSNCYALFWNGAGATKTALGPATSAPSNYYFVCQIVRDANSNAWTYVNGAKGTPISVSGYGIDISNSLFAATSNAGGGFFGGDILYTRIDAEALSDVQLAKEREILQGTLFGSPLSAGSTFSRAASTTSVSQTFSDGTIGYVGTNVPRVSGDGGGVLIEEQRENKALQSQTFGTTWAKFRAGDSISSDSATVLAPDGTATADGLVAEAVDETHYISQNITLTAASWTVSVWAKAGNQNWILLENATTGAYSYFNINTCVGGTSGGGATVARAEQYANGWCRCWFSHTATAASTPIRIYSAEANSDASFAGDGATVNTWLWGAQVELGAHPTSYIPTVAASVIRYADNLTIEPWKITKPAAGPRPTMAARFESDVYATGTYTSEIGGYAFTVNGDTKHVESQTLGDYFSFDGTGDYLSLAAGSDFSPSSNFSFVTIITPASVTGNHTIISNIDGALAGYQLFSVSDGVRLYVNDGSGNTTCTKTSSLIIGKTSLITVSVTRGSGVGDTTCNIYVDNLAVFSDSAQKFPKAQTAVSIASFPSGGEYFNGKIHYLAYYNGTALSATDHTNMYAAFKQSNLLPVKIGNSYEAKKLYVEFDAKCEYTVNDSAVTYMYFLDIGGNTGVSDTDTNRVTIYTINSNAVAAVYAANESTVRYMSTPMTTANLWHHYKLYFNFADLSSSLGYVDTTAFTNNASLTGAKDLDLTNTLIRVGQSYLGTPASDCSLKNLRVRATP